MNVQLYAVIVIILFVNVLFSRASYAKHIIVIYDVSSSMYRLNVAQGDSTRMESRDIRRVNDYLTNIIFSNVSQSLHDRNDESFKECDAAYIGRPLYQSGDIITLAEYAEERNIVLNRRQIRREEFYRNLPNPTNLNQSFPGRVSYLLSAEVEVYDELYRETDDETYWIFITDGDVDRSARNDPNIGDVLQRHAIIEEEYNSPMIIGIIVNNHVRIQVRRIQKRLPGLIYIATPSNRKVPIRNIQLSRDNEGNFISEMLTIDTENSTKTKFKLNNVNVQIVDINNNPLQNLNEDNIAGVLSVSPITLNGSSPPSDFHISLPANREIASPQSLINLEIIYSYDGVDKVFSSSYMPVIKSIYVTTINSPNFPAHELELNYHEGAFNADLIIESENPNKTAFQIKQIRCQIQNKDNDKLCDVPVMKTITRLGEIFQVKLAKQDRLDRPHNQFVLNIDYKYEGDDLGTKVKIPFKLLGGGSGFPTFLFLVFLTPFFGAIGFILFRALTPRIEHHIVLTEVDEDGTPLKQPEFFRIKHKEALYFGTSGFGEHRFDVGCDAYLRCDRKKLVLITDADPKGIELVIDSSKTLTLSKNGTEDKVLVHCDIGDGPN